MRQLCFISFAVVIASTPCLAQTNYDETRVPHYELPDPLKLNNGQKLHDAETWTERRRPEILELFRTHVYGKSPGRPAGLRFSQLEVNMRTLGGIAIRKQVRIHFSQQEDGPFMDMLLYLPAESPKSVPVFLGLNFRGNHTIRNDSDILLSESWMRPGPGVKENRATEESRGVSASRWAVERILARGYGLATIYYGDIDPDFDDGFKNGVHKIYYSEGRTPAGDDWGSIATWAWGLSRALDYLETDKHVDAKRVIVMGHSRLGKTALWAGAEDPRFALVISNNSGCGGAALSRRAFGETVKRINTSFPHWFCDNFNKYNDNEASLPVDQHMLVALMAPRPVYIASAVQDRWADPRGEFLSGVGANPVYRLFEKTGVDSLEMPEVDQPVGGTIGYHVRTGKHDVTDYDWEQYLKFAEKHLAK